LGRINSDPDPVPTPNFTRKETQLTTRATALALKAGPRESAFRHRPLNQGLANRLDPLGDGLQEDSAIGKGRFPIDVEGGGGGGAGALNLGGAGRSEIWT
jgi:hypothetical protein